MIRDRGFRLFDDEGNRQLARRSVFICILTVLFGGCRGGTDQDAADGRQSESPAPPVAAAEGIDDTQERSQPDEGAIRQMAASGQSSSSAIHTPEAQQQTPPTTGNWSRRRVVALLPEGPLLIEFAVSIAGLDLDQANSRIAAQIARQMVEYGGKDSMDWAELLDHPILTAGWLGNLMAQLQNQSDQQIERYDADEDGLASVEELSQFLARVVGRGEGLEIRDVGLSSAMSSSMSPLGPADQDMDNRIDAEEIAQAAASLATLDANHDGVVAIDEVQAPMATAMGGMGSANDSMLDVTSSLAIDSWIVQTVAKLDHRIDRPTISLRERLAELDVDAARRTQRTVRSLLRFYSPLGTLQRQDWPAWSDSKWESFDIDRDGTGSFDEVIGWLAAEPDATIFVRLDIPGIVLRGEGESQGKEADSATDTEPRSRKAEPVMAVASSDPTTRCWGTGPAVQDWSWSPGHNRSRIDLGTALITVQLQDIFSEGIREAFRSQLAASLRDPDLREAITDGLGLSVSAYDLLDADADQVLDDAEFDRVWLWLCAPEATRIQARWSMAASAWFALADLDADNRLSVSERRRFAENLPRYDRDRDGNVVESELPVAIDAQILRNAPRFGDMPTDTLLQVGQQMGGLDWFAATDVNGDGSIDQSEFLGEISDFERFDRNKDAVIDRSEVYEGGSTN